MRLVLNTNSVESYRMFLKIKALPRYRIHGREAWFPDEYSSMLGLAVGVHEPETYAPSDFMFDYQKASGKLAVRKRKFALFIDCGYGKTLIFLDYARHVLTQIHPDQCVLIVSPLMVIRQTIAACKKFYGDSLPIVQVKSGDAEKWLKSGTERLGITNFEAFNNEVNPGRVGCIIIDESSSMNGQYGVWGENLIEFGRGVRWKLCCTGTPAPNDRIEYANHAVFLDQYPTAHAFLASYFVNRGQTDNRWELKPHAVKKFYHDLAHWSFFMSNPAVYGFKDNAGTIPPINIHIHDVTLTDEQRSQVHKAGGDMYGSPGGITSRSTLGQLAKGRFRGEDVPTNKPEFIRNLVDSFGEESAIIWCIYNEEQKLMERTFPNALSIDGSTPYPKRETMIADFQAQKNRVMISKADVLGFGLDLQVATRQVFSGLQDSYVKFYQAVKRSNRVGSTMPLNVHIPITPVERAMVESVLVKAKRIKEDNEEQERNFKESGGWF